VYKRQILGGAYPGRNKNNSHKLIAGYFSETQGDIPIEKNLDVSEIEIKEVDWTGTGFMLIPSSIFESLEYPWFRSYVIKKGDQSALSTEDISICMDVKNLLNKKIFCDCGIRVAHLL
jgi:ABC-type lipopolysaccharide export system ATPase subunit